MDLNRFIKKRPACACMAILIILLHIMLWSGVSGWKLKHITLKPTKVVVKHEYYRLVTNSFFHIDLMHLAINLAAIGGTGRSLEKRFGTFNLLWISLFSAVVGSVVYTMAAYQLAQSLDDKAWIKTGCVGFSGIIFHWVVISCYQKDGERHLRFFENLHVPAAAYPWVSMLVWYMIDPENVRGALGHFIGIIMGLVHVNGYFGPILPPVNKARKRKAKNRQSSTVSTEAQGNQPAAESNTATKISNETSLREARLKRFQ